MAWSRGAYRPSYNRMWGIASLAVAATLATPVVAAAESTGGMGFSTPPPSITRVECKKGCAVTAANRARAVAVGEDAVVVVRGRNLHETREVTFLGGRGTTDDVAFIPRRPGKAAITVKVPEGAPSGPLRVVNATGATSRPSAVAVRIVEGETQAAAELGADPAAGGGLSPSGQLLWPVGGTVTSPFGPRWGRLHAGIDIAIRGGTPIKAAAGGTVAIADWVSGYGNYVCVAHVSITTCYAHQPGLLVTKGQQVSRGQIIGKVGCTGNCYGDHLHFEVRLGIEEWSDPADPMPYLPPRSSSAKAGMAAPLHGELPWGGPEHDEDDH